MSISRSVVPHRSVARGFVALTLVMASGLLAGPAPVAGARPRDPVNAGGSDPTARIAALSSLVDQRDTAVTDAIAQRDATSSQLVRATLAEDLSLAHADALSRDAAAAERRYAVARDRAGTVAAAVYRSAGDAQDLMRLLDSKTVAEYGYRRSLSERVGEIQSRVVRAAVRTRRLAVKVAAAAERARLRYHQLVLQLTAELPQREQDVNRAQDQLSRAKFWLTRWQSIAAGVNTPIMSRSILSGSELTRWFTGTHRRARITVPMEELAQDFVDEGTAAGVRGDIAFAQSILETGSFYFPDGGQLTPADNNFAGMDACDSCAHGRSFPDARTGVRAQVQQLRVYADPNVTNASFNPPPVVANLDQHSLKGKVPTWNGLTHTWATADAYGDRIIEIYAGILAWLTDRSDV
jgi:hypothetical protein